MSRRANHSVVKRKSQSRFVGEMGVDYIGREIVALAESREKRFCVRFYVASSTDGKQELTVEQFCLFVIAKDSGTASLLLVFKKLNDFIFLTVKKDKLRRRSVMLVFHSGRERTLVFTQSALKCGGDGYVVANTAKRVVGYSAGAEKDKPSALGYHYDSRFETDLASAAVDYHINSAKKILDNVFYRGGRGFA